MSDSPASQTPTTSPTTIPVHIAGSEPVASLRVSQIHALTWDVRQLQERLAYWAPLEQAYHDDMARRTAGGFKVETLDVWVADLARRMDSTSAEDGGAVSDRHNEYAGHGD